MEYRVKCTRYVCFGKYPEYQLLFVFVFPFYYTDRDSNGRTKVPPYAAIKDKKFGFKAQGLPQGINFKDPGSYGPSQMRRILSVATDIKFDINLR